MNKNMKKMLRTMELEFERHGRVRGQHTLDPRRYLEAADSRIVNEDYSSIANLSRQPVYRQIEHDRGWANVWPSED